MSVTCEICGETGAMRPFYPRYEIVQCPVCELVFYAGDAEASYDEAYFKGAEYTDYVADKAIAQRNFQRRIAELKQRQPGGGKLLEVGSAYGFFLELASRHWEVKGIDVAPDGVRYARETLGLEVLEADFLTLPDEPEAYDLICMWDTIEHLPHPARFVEKAARWLKPGGSLVVTTGDVASLVSRARGDRWRMVHPPTHLYYFSPRTLGQAMTRAGLAVEGVKHVGYDRSLRQILHGVLAAGGKKTARLYDDALAHIAPDWPIYLNLYDIMMITAVKPASESRSLPAATVAHEAV